MKKNNDILHGQEERDRLKLLLWMRENSVEHLSDLSPEDIKWILNKREVDYDHI